MVVGECCSLVDLYTGIRDGSNEFCPPVDAFSSFLRPSKSGRFLWLWRVTFQTVSALQSSSKVRRSCLLYLLEVVVKGPRDSNTVDACTPIRYDTAQDLTTGRTDI